MDICSGRISPPTHMSSMHEQEYMLEGKEYTETNRGTKKKNSQSRCNKQWKPHINSKTLHKQQNGLNEAGLHKFKFPQSIKHRRIKNAQVFRIFLK